MAKLQKLKFTTNEWINKAKLIHGEEFDYSKSIYKGSSEKIKIICKIHGPFMQRASHHLEGSKCKKCRKESERKTLNEFITDSRKFHGDYYDYSKVKFKNIHDKVEIICPIHGSFIQKPVKHQKGQGCKKCTKGEVWDLRDFLEKAKKIHSKKFNYTKSIYVNTSTKIKIICNTCNHSFLQIPNAHLRGCGCPKCANKIPITEDMFKEILKDVHSQNIFLISSYTNKTNKVEVQCKEGHKWQTTPNHLIKRKQGCRKCHTLSKRMSDSQFKKILKENHQGEIIALEKYVQSKTRLKVKCMKCGKIYSTEPRNVMRNGCHNCANRRTPEEFEKKLKEMHLNEIVALEKYKTHRDYIKVRHKCGFIWSVQSGELIRKDPAGCPLCASSKGNKLIQKILVKNNIEFEREKRFPTCKYKIPMPFDFFIPQKKILIEFDGEQHFIAIDFWGGQKGLEERMAKDNIKDEWAKKNNYKLFRIKFDANINSEMKKILNLVG